MTEKNRGKSQMKIDRLADNHIRNKNDPPPEPDLIKKEMLWKKA